MITMMLTVAVIISFCLNELEFNKNHTLGHSVWDITSFANLEVWSDNRKMTMPKKASSQDRWWNPERDRVSSPAPLAAISEVPKLSTTGPLQPDVLPWAMPPQSKPLMWAPMAVLASAAFQEPRGHVCLSQTNWNHHTFAWAYSSVS